ncbi:MAG: hypothetical protein J7L47_11365 [Candidatus Odinarchaeota archaeon]|nr:hypothetical protein [Candidatus Odinarchaeota archaeon]
MKLLLFFLFLATNVDDQLNQLWKNFTDGIGQIWKAITDSVGEGIGESIGKFFSGLGDLLNSIFNPLTNWFEGAGRATNAAWDFFVAMAGGDATVATMIIILVPIGAVLLWKFKGALV